MDIHGRGSFKTEAFGEDNPLHFRSRMIGFSAYNASKVVSATPPHAVR